MSDNSGWFTQTKLQTLTLSEAYRLRLLGRLWWANLIFVVLPAAFATVAAIFAAGPGGGNAAMASPAAAWLAAAAAVLTAIHRALKCEEYQAECLRLSQAYQSIAISANSALSRPEKDHDSLHQELTRKLELLTESAKAPLPTGYIRKAETQTRYNLYGQSTPNVKAKTHVTTET